MEQFVGPYQVKRNYLDKCYRVKFIKFSLGSRVVAVTTATYTS